MKDGERYVRMLEPQLRHTHGMYNKITFEPTQFICKGVNCPICRFVKRIKHVPWYRNLWTWIKELITRFKENEL